MENIKSKKLLKLSIVLVLLTAMFVGSAVPAQAASKYISKSKAITIATKNAKVSKNSKKFRLDDADLERKGKTRVWDIEFYYGNTKYEYDINAKTKKIIKKKKTTPKKKVTSTKPVYIGVDKAKSIALAHAKKNSTLDGKVTYTTAKLDKDDGKMIYEIEFYSGGMEYEYEINAKTGEIIEWDIDRD